MQRKLFHFIIFVGVFLVGVASVTGNCDVAKVTDCVLQVADPSFQQRFQNINETELDSTCSFLNSTLECVAEARRTCNSRQLADLAILIRAVEVTDTQYCNRGFECLTKVRDCMNTEPELLSLFSGKQVTLTGFGHCPGLAKVMTCLENKLPKQCLLPRNVRDTVASLTQIHEHCREGNCTAMQECQSLYLMADSVTTGMNNQTCYLMANYTGCLESASQSCPHLKTPRGEPSPAVVSELMEELCQLMGEGEISGLYNCAEFSRCIDLQKAGRDQFSVQNQCRHLQSIVGCAVSTIQRCRLTFPATLYSFLQSANQFALKASAMGCGIAEVHTASCTDFQACKTAIATLKPDISYNERCAALNSFQSCTHNARVACNLTKPIVDDVDDNTPRLDRLTAIFGRMCDALYGQIVTTCQQYTECLANANLPANDAALMDEKSWCELTLHTLQCVLFYEDECPVPAALKEKVDTLYAQTVWEGCHNTYGVPVPEAPPSTIVLTTTTPRSTSTSRPIITPHSTTTSQTTVMTRPTITSRPTTTSRNTTTSQPTKPITSEPRILTEKSTAPERISTTPKNDIPVDNTETKQDDINKTNDTNNDDNSNNFKPSDNTDSSDNNATTDMPDDSKPTNNTDMSDNTAKPNDTDNNVSDNADDTDNTNDTSDSAMSTGVDTSDSGAKPVRGIHLMSGLPLALAVFVTRCLV